MLNAFLVFKQSEGCSVPFVNENHMSHPTTAASHQQGRSYDHCIIVETVVFMLDQLQHLQPPRPPALVLDLLVPALPWPE
eukprot:m.231662 g.231662  ORF g.231662 m.231662 type:complete len:80 (-) comp15221_c0_seq3:1884-2123(-)